MIRDWLVTILIVTLAAVPSSSSAEEPEHVMVLPVSVHSDGRGALTDVQATALVRQQLTEAGISTVEAPPGAAAGSESANPTSIRAMGLAHGAQRVLWGSLSLVGTAFSIDLQMLDTRTAAPPEHFYAQGDGLETLAIELKTIVGRIGAIVFRQESIAGVEVRGNNRIETDAILRKVHSRAGDRLDRQRLAEDLKSVFDMGYFDDVRVLSEMDATGKVVVFEVQEKPTIRRIQFSGNKKIDDDKLKENLTLRSGAILNAYTIQKNMRIIEDQYKAKSYHYVQVRYETQPLKNNQADLKFIIDEGKRIRIEHIRIEGNTAFDQDELTDLMETSEEGFFSFVTESGKLDREVLQSDAAKIAAFYQNNGFVEARAGEPQVVFTESGIDVTIKVDEGPRYKIGTVTITGDMDIPVDELRRRLQVRTGEYFSREQMRRDVMALTEAVADEGYAFADVQPKMIRNEAERTMAVTYTIRKGRQVYFERILISGNAKTRDKVIRRELRVYEQGRYSGSNLKRSVRNLYRLDFFEDIKVDTPRGSGDDKMLLKINVTDKATGQFIIGGGYSTEDQFYAQGSVSQNNLFGLGEVLNFSATLGSRSTKYDLTFIEPWLFDLPLQARIRGFNWQVHYTDNYDKDSIGGEFSLSYPVWDYTRLGTGYKLESTELGGFTENTPDSVRELEGTNVTSSVSSWLRYDSRDRVINPSEGVDTGITAEYAGLGGDIGYTKLLYDGSVYIPLIWKMSAGVHAKAGWVAENPGMILPDYAKFYLGGINSMRGFDWREIGVDETNADGEVVVAGGEKMMQYNLEWIVPLVPEAGVMGVVFWDAGNVWDSSTSYRIEGMRHSYGAGFRWFSPLGPIRLEYGWIYKPEADEEQHGRWQFSMGAAF